MASNDNTPIVQAVAVSEIRGADATPLLEAIPAEAVEYSPFATTEAIASDQRRASNPADTRACRDGAGDAAVGRRGDGGGNAGGARHAAPRRVGRGGRDHLLCGQQDLRLPFEAASVTRVEGASRRSRVAREMVKEFVVSTRSALDLLP